jgi:Kef-type K+ transport system membrane component KefB
MRILKTVLMALLIVALIAILAGAFLIHRGFRRMGKRGDAPLAAALALVAAPLTGVPRRALPFPAVCSHHQ